MNTVLNFENDETKELLAKLNFKYFLDRNIEVENYDKSNIDKINSSYKKELTELKNKEQSNKRQFNYYVEGKVRKGFTGGFLPGFFELDDSRKNTIFDFSAVGKDWAYFEYWQKYQKRKITKEKIWNVIVKGGSILAIILSIIKFAGIIKTRL